MSKPSIEICVADGRITDINWPKELEHLFRVVVRDYDGPEFDAVDPEGVRCAETIWEDPA